MDERQRDNHYVPQFYLRQFACADDLNKVAVLRRHEPFLVADRKSIAQMGYEEDLHALHAGKGALNLEGVISKTIETPFSSSPTWTKIASGNVRSLDASDRRALYAFNTHLQTRNLEALRFLEKMQARIRESGFPPDFTQEERDMHTAIASDPDGVRAFFLMGAIRPLGTIDRSAEGSVLICHTKLRLRTTTCPPLPMGVPPTYSNADPSDVDGPKAWWLPLTPYCGALITRGTPFAELAHMDIEDDAVRMFNRRYLVQLREGLSVRYCLADDVYLDVDLDWAGYDLVTRSKMVSRYERRDRQTTPSG